jgi:hypothetical protein
VTTTEPIPADDLTQIRVRVKYVADWHQDLTQTEIDRAELLDEVDRLRAQVERMQGDRPAYQAIADEAVAESNRLRGLLGNAEYLVGRVRELRQAEYEADLDAERDRDAAGGEL